MPESKPVIVLVHGAWADGSSWTNVLTRLLVSRPDVVVEVIEQAVREVGQLQPA